MYANTDSVDTDECQIPVEKREEIDLWLLSKYNGLVKYVTESFDEYDLNKVVRAIASFVSDDLSNWYIRRNRKRFWGSEMNDSKKSVYITTYEVLVGLCKLIAPITPFIAEEMYRDLTGEESVHLTDYPVYDKKLINLSLEEKMDTVREIIRLGRNIREEVKIKVREPLPCVYLDGKKKSILGNLVPLIEEELNVKSVEFISDLSEYMNFTIKPNFKEVGKIFGSKMKDFTECLSHLSTEEMESLENGEEVSTTMNGETLDITPSMVDIRVDAKEGFFVAMENNLFVILNTERTKDLILEGIAREFVSKVQNLRKQKDFDVVDRIIISYYGTSRFDEVLEKFEDYIKEETLALEFKTNPELTNSYDLNGEEVLIDVEKI